MLFFNFLQNGTSINVAVHCVRTYIKCCKCHASPGRKPAMLLVFMELRSLGFEWP